MGKIKHLQDNLNIAGKDKGMLETISRVGMVVVDAPRNKGTLSFNLPPKLLPVLG